MKLQVFKILKLKYLRYYIDAALGNEDNIEFFRHKLIPAVIKGYYSSDFWFEERFYMPLPLNDDSRLIILSTCRRKGIFIQVRFERMASITLNHKHLQYYLR